MPDGGFPAPRAGRWMTTRWSLVLAAVERANARSAEALARLCEMYWYPVYAFIRRPGCHPEEGRQRVTFDRGSVIPLQA